MNLYHQLTNLLPIIYPKFYTTTDRNQNVLVLLDTGEPHQAYIEQAITDRTQFEALENHVHLFDSISKHHYAAARKIGVSIGQNLYNELNRTYPSKSFIVYLTINSDGAILRFHQVWDGEPPYFDETAQYDAEVIIFRTPT